MNQEIVFAKTVEEILRLARTQGNMLQQEQVEEAFAAMEIIGERLKPVYEYLKSKGIGVGKEPDRESGLTLEDRDYLEEYLESLNRLPVLHEGEKRALFMAAIAGEEAAKRTLLQAFLPKVAEIARLYTNQGVLLEDLIGEGNVALTMTVEILGCLEDPGEVEGMLAKSIMDAMEEAVEENSRAKQADRKLADKINRVCAFAEELADTLRRKVTVEELAKETSLTEEEIREAIRLSQDQIEHIEG